MWTQTKFACQLLAISNLIHQIVLNMTYTQTGASNCVITLCNFCKEHLEGLQQHKLHCKFQLLVTGIILSLTDTTVHTTLDDFLTKSVNAIHPYFEFILLFKVLANIQSFI